MESIDDRLRRLMVALERVDSRWRRAHALSANERIVIAFLVVEGALAPLELSRLVGITTAGMTTLLDRLEAAGYIARRRNPRDGRRVLVTPTKKAMRARMEFEEVSAEIARAVPAEDEAAVLAFLEQAAALALRRSEAPGDAGDA